MSASETVESKAVIAACWQCGVDVEDELRFCHHCGASLDKPDDAEEESLLGTVIAGNYKLVEVIGSGSMGKIYKAEQLSLGKIVVIKLLLRHLLGDITLSKRFQREARAASILNHPNLIHVIDFGQMEDGPLYIAMEYVAGTDLAQLLYEEYPLDDERMIHIVKQVCFALDEAHAKGVLHRDLKPENIMVGDRRATKDFVKVLDFGIAKLQDSAANPDTFNTVAGVVCGTPEYMSPEQARGDLLDPRTDLYALGIILYQLLTNRLPFEGESALHVVTQHLSEPPIPPSKIVPDVNKILEALTLALLAKDRAARPASALDVVAELEKASRQSLESMSTTGFAAMADADTGGEEGRGEIPTKRDLTSPSEADLQDATSARRAGPGASNDLTTHPTSPVHASGHLKTARKPRNLQGQEPSVFTSRFWLFAVLLGLGVLFAGLFLYMTFSNPY
jgi:serine/threonine protein kinase